MGASSIRLNTRTTNSSSRLVPHTDRAKMDQLPEAVAQLLHSVSPAHLCQACFALASCAVLAVAITPTRERKLLVNYGARSHGAPTADTASAAATRHHRNGSSPATWPCAGRFAVRPAVGRAAVRVPG